MRDKDDRTSRAGAIVGVLSAALFVAALFGGYALLTGENPGTQFGYTQTEPTPKPNPDPLPVTPQSEQRAPVTDTDANKTKDPESSSQDAN